MSAKLKAVFDTQIFLRALIKRTSLSAQIASPEFKHRYVLCVSDAIEAEISEVLNRASIRSKFPQITDELVKGTLSDLADAKRILVEVVEPISRDPKDDIFLACAKAANADYLVSEDQDLLVLKKHSGAKIVDALTFLNILKDTTENMSG